MLRALILLFLMGTEPLPALETPRIAVIDMTAAFNAHPEAEKAEADLNQKRAAAGKVFNAKANELKNLLDEHQKLTLKLITAGEKAGDEQKAKARELLDRATELEREVAAIRTTQERDLMQQFVEERRRILKSIATVIGEFNAAGTYALVLDLSAASANGIPQILHAPGAEDITQEIVKLLKKGKKRE
jgi:Skp family chaperone for outer membrane proteins